MGLKLAYRLGLIQPGGRNVYSHALKSVEIYAKIQKRDLVLKRLNFCLAIK